MNSFSFKVDLEKYNNIKAFYLPYQVQEGKDYVDFISEYNGVTVIGYTSNKSKRTVFFKGDNAFDEASRWEVEIQETRTRKIVPTEWIDLDNQIGSDEVGVGDFLLPMIVCAALVRKSQIGWLKSLEIDDSKKMSD